ncbi:MAG: RecQ family ATP-dependent DNA helicase [Succinivibrionaceae bacterium]
MKNFLNIKNIENEMKGYLSEIYGPEASFRDGQLDAIIKTLTNKFTLIVQKTGWGKSLIYFFVTKYLRERGYAPTIIVSPLISLMNNQKMAAQKCGLTCEIIDYNSIKNGNWYLKIENDEVDIIYITPEQLNNKNVKNVLINSIKKEISFFVIDEAHCISEWGHDFRPAFLEIKNFINQNLMLDRKVHLLATTATANDAVINDLKEQFDEKIEVLRGPLTRESLSIDVIPELSLSERYAWIYNFIKKEKGSGIVYCLTIRESNNLKNYLSLQGINVRSYNSKIESGERLEIEQDFYDNKIQVLVATTALGMGYDKPDISFVIHLQNPKSMLEYYQQIGRAGRSIPCSKVILMCGKEDDRIAKYFIEHAAPEPQIMRDVLNYIDQCKEIKISQLLSAFNIKNSEMDSILRHLLARNLILKNEKSAYSRTLKEDDIDSYIIEKDKINKLRLKNREVIKKYTKYDGCYMEFISRELNDPYAKKCGKCANCIGKHTVIDLSCNSL